MKARFFPLMFCAAIVIFVIACFLRGSAGTSPLSTVDHDSQQRIAAQNEGLKIVQAARAAGVITKISNSEIQVGPLWYALDINQKRTLARAIAISASQDFITIVDDHTGRSLASGSSSSGIEIKD